MQIRVEGNMMIHQLQEVFTQAFPFLKVEFFKKGVGALQQRHTAQNIIGPEKKFKEIPHFRECVESIEIAENMTVQELESMFDNCFGLAIQVFRRSGNLWLETTVTDTWSLKRQNDHGQEISAPFKK